jgi:hypothetical protein
MNTRTSAKSIGNNDAKSAELAAAIRKAYAKAKPEQQAELAHEFKVGYIAGRDRVSISEAEAIVEAGKGAEAINAPAITRATAAWNYHIIGKLEPKAAAPIKRQRISKEVRASAEAFLAQFDSVAEAIKVLRLVAGK